MPVPERTEGATPQAKLILELGAAQVRQPGPVDEAQHLMRLADDPLLVRALLQRAGDRTDAKPAMVKMPMLYQANGRGPADAVLPRPAYGATEPLHPPSLAAEAFASTLEDRERAFTIWPDQPLVSRPPRRRVGPVAAVAAAALAVFAILALIHN